MDSQIETVGKDSLDAFRRFYRTIYAIPTVLFSLILGFVALFTCFFAGENLKPEEIYYAVICLVLAALVLRLPRIIANRAYRNRLNYYGDDIPELTARFGNELVLEDSDSLHTFPYEKITRVYFIEENLVIVVVKDRAVCIPVREFTRGSMSELKQFLREKCPNVKIPD